MKLFSTRLFPSMKKFGIDDKIDSVYRCTQAALEILKDVDTKKDVFLENYNITYQILPTKNSIKSKCLEKIKIDVEMLLYPNFSRFYPDLQFFS